MVITHFFWNQDAKFWNKKIVTKIDFSFVIQVITDIVLFAINITFTATSIVLLCLLSKFCSLLGFKNTETSS